MRTGSDGQGLACERASHSDGIGHDQSVGVQFGLKIAEGEVVQLQLLQMRQRGSPVEPAFFRRDRNVVAGEVPLPARSTVWPFTSFQKLRSRPSPPVASLNSVTWCSRHMVQPASNMIAESIEITQTIFHVAILQ